MSVCLCAHVGLTHNFFCLFLLSRGRSWVCYCTTAAVWLWTSTGSSVSTGGSSIKTSSPPSGPSASLLCSTRTRLWSFHSTAPRLKPTSLALQMFSFPKIVAVTWKPFPGSSKRPAISFTSPSSTTCPSSAAAPTSTGLVLTALSGRL